MTIIKRTEVPYLNEDVIEKYKNVIIISAEGTMIKMNSLILSAMSHSLKMALLDFDDFDGDHTIITEFSLEELKQVKEYCTKGSCNAMTELLMMSFGLLRPEHIEEKINEKYSTFKLSESKSSEITTSYDNSLVKTEIPMKYEVIGKKHALKNMTSSFEILAAFALCVIFYNFGLIYAGQYTVCLKG